MPNGLYNLVTNLKTQLQGINGQSGYNYNLSDQQVAVGFLGPQEVDTALNPFVCIATADENLIPQTINQVGSDVSFYEPHFEIEVFGYFKEASYDSAMLGVLKLLSDIEKAIMSDDQFGSSKAYGVQVNSVVGNFDRAGVCALIISGKY